MTMSINTGLASGIDTGTMINQLMQLEARQQTALKIRLSTTEITASAYRTVNSSLAALTTAADSLLKPETWTSTTASSSAASVAVTAASYAQPGSLTFTVSKVATTASSVSTGRWSSTTTAAGLTSLDIRSADGTVSKGTIALDGTETLEQAAAKINADTALGLKASAVQVAPGEFALQISAGTSGAAAGFTIGGTAFTATTVGQNAELKVGSDTATTSAYTVTSASNTFEGVLSGTTFTVSKEETTPVTVTVAADPAAVATKVSGLVDAINKAISTIKTYTDNTPGSKAGLRGEYAVTSISAQLGQAVSEAVGTDGSPAQIGFQTTREGLITFDKEKFTAALQATPDLAQRIVAGSGVAGEPDAVEGLAARVRDVAKAASDATTGSLTSMAQGQDSVARDIKDRIAAWDIRLTARKAALTRQFTAMETALSSLNNQSNWLAGQLGSLSS
ncbi:flagellar filament capping protein FliD [Blastococcus goldschmidtiae]|uniref:Flagellar hook-associated protein 2 n=1 Tax=Blastococcus goldschmidtiae TaxID=3075546 RepID=A0ABU2K606_9ACTN|nr:flagellar filament capping protein FliD [Blastococcus sp. DSM 46792]MDT0275637.1 flagellar filament capping protein FliD [Blastococcus sp. DSM 46792]